MGRRRSLPAGSLGHCVLAVYVVQITSRCG